MKEQQKVRVIAALVLAGSLVPALEVSSQRDTTEIFVDRLDVRVINLEVVVEDAAGRRVSGLQREDFVLQVDGEDVVIDYFAEIRRTSAVGSVAEGPQGQIPSAEEGEAPVGVHYLIFVDNLLSSAPARNQVLQGLIDQLTLLQPAKDQMAVVAFGGRRPRLLSDWTGSPQALREALETAMGLGVANAAETRLPSEARYGRVNALDSDPQEEVQYRPLGPLFLEGQEVPAIGLVSPESVRSLERDLERVVAAATATMTRLQHVPGRKVLLLLTGSWPASVSGFLHEGPVVSTDRGMDLYRGLHETAALLNYTLYPVYTAAPLPGTRNQGRMAELRWAVHQIAKESGGLPLFGEDRHAVLERVTEDTRAYYSLGFNARMVGDDRQRSLKVQVRRPGLKVRHRTGYRDLSGQRRAELKVDHALYFGIPRREDGLRMSLGEPRRKRNAVWVPVELHIPLDVIAMLPVEDRYAADLELRVAVLGPDGYRNEVQVVPLRFEGARPQPGQHVIYATELKLRDSDHDIALSLYDRHSGAVLAAAESVRP